MSVVELQGLSVRRGKALLLDGIDFRVARDEFVGIVGPNGAGKTTLIRILATLLEPTFGQVSIGGIDALAHPLRVHPLIGYMSDFFALYEQMLVWEYLDHFARCYAVPARRRDALIGEVLELVSLEVRRDAEIRTLSRGMRQRLCFAKTLLHEPRVLLLDEPASGLDPAGRLEFRELLRKLHEMGRTVLISSHILTEMTEFCTSIGILECGRLVAAGRVDEILARLQPDLELEIELREGADRLAERLAGDPRIGRVETDGTSLRCSWRTGRETLPQFHRELAGGGFELISFAVKKNNLEDIYMRLSGHHTS